MTNIKLEEVLTDDQVRGLNPEELVEKVAEWATERNLNTAEPKNQFLKLAEEAGEIAVAYINADVAEIRDSIGDTLVVLTVLSTQLGLDPKETITEPIKSAEELVQKSGAFFLWSFRGNNEPSTAEEDLLVLTSIVGHVAGELARNNEEKISTLIQNISKVVSYISYRTLHQSPIEGLREAYNVIKHRKGKLIDGVFVKEEDLNE